MPGGMAGQDETGVQEYLKDKFFGLFPRKLRSAEVTVCSSLLVDRPLQVQLPKKNIKCHTFTLY